MRRKRMVRVCPRIAFLILVLVLCSHSAVAATETLLTTQTPALLNVTDGSSANYELGVKFITAAAGQINAIRFWKASKETGTHIGRVWSLSGQILASVTFASETASGWQQQALPTPLTVTANTTYVVTVNTGQTFYVDTIGGLTTKISSAHLSTVTGSNGVYGPTGRFPTTTYKSSNYFRDVVFTPTATSGLASSASSLDLGSVDVGSSTSQTLTLTNKATSRITISNVAASGSGYSASGITAPLTLSPGQQTSLKVSFAPTVMGTATGTVTVTSNASNPSLTTSLKGVGKQPRISAVPASVAFGSVAIGVANTQTVTLSNPGNSNLVISQSTVSGSGFTASGLTFPLTITPGTSAALTVRFAPTSAVAYTATLTLWSNAPGSPLAVPLTGTGVKQAAQLSSTPSSVSFGNVTQSTMMTQSVTLKNSGNTSLSVSKISATGTYFAANSPALPVTLAPGQTVSFNTTFDPLATGTFSGSVSIVSTATNSTLSIPLSGTGMAAPTHKATLTWTPSTSSVVGYNVYRGTQSGGPYTKLNTSTVAGSTYTDSAVQAGSTYYYVVTSLASNGLESVHSSQVSGTIP